MRRIIQNTTAIAACLSLLAPHAALAQAEAPEADAQVEVQADTAAEAEAAADAVAEAVEAVTGACADGSEPPCEVAAEEAPAAEAEAAAEVEAEAEAAPEAEAAAETAPVEEAPAEAAAPEAAPAEAEAAAEAPAVEPAPEAEAAAEEPAAEPAVEAEAEAVTPEAEPAPAEEAAAEEPIEPALEPTTEAEEAPAAAEAEATTEAEAEAPMTEEAAEVDELEKTLAEEQAKTEATTETEAEPTAEAEAETPDPVVTEAAKEAAAAAAATSAAALDAGEGEGEVTEEQVTEENTRSSSEDFTTALKDALAAQGGETQQAEASNNDDDDDRSDLTKAVLFGLGGLAVGAMLNNNRQVALSSPDRVVVTRADGTQQIIKDEVALLRQPGSTVTTENFDDGSSRTTVTRADGSKVVTIRDADLRVLRRTLVSVDGTQTRLIDDTGALPVDLATLPKPAEASVIAASEMSDADLRAALMRESDAGRQFSLAQVRDIPQVRWLAAPINIDAITFDTGSAAINPDQAQKLSGLGNVIRESIAENPAEVFLIEAHTDTVGTDAANLALSDRRAESVALALTEYFDVPPENMVVQGYGEQDLKVKTEGDVRENRRASVRRITGLLQQASN
ncbi:OmpA family protein [uncultured Paracoccus sp.]|uniref:OmpA family protein n=1 Tax=uncultured Paracoccus sp. TaxID=189685 RepID=UPI002605F70C|nr:OmpA family protein [uncultured Paracoccus sp.]